MDLFAELNRLMVKYRFRPNRKMAQLFIISQEVLDRMVKEAGLSAKDMVLEIGAGTGFLSRELQKKCRVIAVELDDTLFRLLENELPRKNLELIHGNFLDLEFGKFNKVVSLPPYTVSSEIMYRLFELKPKLSILVFQKEFVERLLAQPGFVEYNALSVLTQYYFRVKMLCRVPAGSFFPKPSSDSALVKLELSRKREKAADERLFKLFIKSVFRFQNKNLLNAVKNSMQFMGVPRRKRGKIIAELSAHPLGKEKVNLIACSDFVKLFNRLFR
jgi:16S rRNA (adenine1518-N6/adenine1519-N6)-dimethyltransferase